MNTLNVMNFYKFVGKHESCKLKPYKCTAGKTTIGWGRNLDDKGITQREADLLLYNDINDVIKELNEYLPWWSSHSENIQKILVDMCFNLGINGLLEFKRTLALIRDQRYYEASVEVMKSKWAKQVGERAKEISLMLSDEAYRIQTVNKEILQQKYSKDVLKLGIEK